MKKTLDDIKIIPFLKAMNDKDHKIIGVSKDEFEDLINDYIRLLKENPNNFEKRLKKIEDKIFIVSRTLFVLNIEIADEEMMSILRDQGYHMQRDTYFDDIEKVVKDLKVLEFKKTNLKDKMPKKATSKNKEKNDNIYIILTNLSSGLEMSLNFEPMVVNEFIAWKKQFNMKVKSMEKNKPKNNVKR